MIFLKESESGIREKRCRVEQILCDPSNKRSRLIAAEALQTFKIHPFIFFLFIFFWLNSAKENESCGCFEVLGLSSTVSLSFCKIWSQGKLQAHKYNTHWISIRAKVWSVTGAGFLLELHPGQDHKPLMWTICLSLWYHEWIVPYLEESWGVTDFKTTNSIRILLTCVETAALLGMKENSFIVFGGSSCCFPCESWQNAALGSCPCHTNEGLLS